MLFSQGQRDKDGEESGATQGSILRHLCVGQRSPNRSLGAHLGRKLERWAPSYSSQAKLASLREEGERRGAKGQAVDLDGEGCVSVQKQLLKSRAYLLSCELRETDFAFGRAHVAQPTSQSQPDRGCAVCNP